MAPSSRDFGLLVDWEEEERPHEPSQAPGGAAIRSRSVASVVGAVVGVAVVVAVFALGGPSTAKFLARRRAEGGELVLAAGTSTPDPYPWGSVTVPECGKDYKIEKVMHSNLGGQGPDNGEEGIVYKCTESDNGKFVRELLIKVHALSDYASESAHKNGMHHGFGSISVDSGKKVKVRFSVWDLEDKPLTTNTFRITFYDLDEGPHGSSKEYIIADDMHPDAQRTWHTEVKKEQHHGDLEFTGSHVGSSRDNPSNSHHLSKLQKERSVVVEYQDVHYFDMTMGATPGHSPRGFAFSLHSALACHDVKLAITTTFTTTQTFVAGSPERRAALLKFLSASAKIRHDGGDMSIPDLFKSPAANPSHADEGDILLDASEVRQICQEVGEDFSPEDADSVIEDLDGDGDGKVDFSEVMASMQFYEAVSKFSNHRVDVSEPFQGKELLDPQEVRSIHLQDGVEVSQEEARSVVAQLDVDGDGKLSKAELEMRVPFVEAILKTIDNHNLINTADVVESYITNPSRATQGDELLDASEVRSIYQEVGEDLSLQDARSRILDLDVDGDAMLAKEELVMPMRFYKAISSMPGDNRNRISDLLKNHAYNPSHALTGDELLDVREVRDVVQKAGPKPSLQDASELVASLDADGDGQLGIDELVPITPLVPSAITPFVPPAAEPAPFPWWLLLLLVLLLLCCLLCLLLLCCRGKEETVEEAPRTYAPVVKQKAKAAPQPPYMTLRFVDAESKAFVGTWYDRPLGFTYAQDETPVYVTKVVKGGRAEQLGVKTGMKLTGIEFTGQAMTSVENKYLEVTNNLLARGAAVLPHVTDRPYVELTFVKPPSQEVLVKTWYTQPLGFGFSPQTPLVVKEVSEGSRAWELGVHPGMELRSVACTGMPAPVHVQGKTYKTLMRLVSKGMQSLPAAS